MRSKYNRAEAMDKLATTISDYVEKAVKNLHYDKTYTGTITSKTGDTYTVKIYGAEYTVKCKYNFPVGKSMDVLAKQNNMSNLSFVVRYDDLI